MRIPLISAILLVSLAAGCASQSSTKPVEILDQRTGMTVAALKEPIEFVPGAQTAAIISRKRSSFAYVGPVEWNRSGALSYGLWVHIVPGIDPQPGDIHAAAALTLRLQDGTLDLSLIEAPKLGVDPYRQVVSWGQTAYFGLTPEALRRMAASPTLQLDVRAADGSIMSFSPTQAPSSILTRYVQSRSITGD
ncbi:MAG TPA: hypothetical protein VGO37_08255 [Steroidobacteraceae bacterium]|jgi:hypothetical protein|nr:hypothetical protein [Steroidobacteraceae bacterium]